MRRMYRVVRGEGQADYRSVEGVSVRTSSVNGQDVLVAEWEEHHLWPSRDRALRRQGFRDRLVMGGGAVRKAPAPKPTASEEEPAPKPDEFAPPTMTMRSLEDLPYSTLQSLAKKRGLPATGKAETLIARLRGHDV